MNRSKDFAFGPNTADWDYLERDLNLDPATFEIIRHKLVAINEEQGIALKTMSVSPVVNEASDFGCGLYTPDGKMVTMGAEIVFQAACIPLVIDSVIEDCSDNPGIREGDMFIVNDPYKGAIHHPDVTLVAPIYYQGELVAWSGVSAHQVDMGGMSIGSLCAKATEKQQEGLMMPPLRLVENDQVRGDVWRLIMNMTRQPQMVSLDIKGFVSANMIARRRLLELIDQYGIDTIKLVMSELIRYSERRFRERLLELPNGEFQSQGFIDHDGHQNNLYRTDIKLIKDNDTLRFDFSGSSLQAPGFINATKSALIGGVFGGTAPLMGSKIPWNHGILNAIEVIAPEGLICNARSPAPTSSATIAEGWIIVNTVVHVVSKMLMLSPKYRHHAQAVSNGTFHSLHMGELNQHGEPYGTHLMDAQLGGGGASFQADGLDSMGGFPSLRPCIPNIESSEMQGPMLFLYRSSFPDSAGDGKFRGGRAAGAAVVPYDVDEWRCVFTTQGIEVPVSPGQSGAYPGKCNRHMVIRDTRVMELLSKGELPLQLDSPNAPLNLDTLGGTATVPPAKTDEFKVSPGDVIEFVWAGGGGYGDPLKRPPEQVADDVQGHIISAHRAKEVYGVVIVENELNVDATAELRQQMVHERLEDCRLPSQKYNQQTGDRLTQVGMSLYISRLENELQIECECGYVFGPATDNWKIAAASRSPDEKERPEGLVFHKELELAQYLCPNCGTIHASDVKERKSSPVQDIKLTGYGEFQPVKLRRQNGI